MTIEIDASGQRHRVDVVRRSGGWAVVIDGRERFVSVAEAGGRWSMLVSDSGYVASGLSPEYVASGFSRTFRSYELAFESPSQGELLVAVNGHAMSVAVNGRRATRSRGHHRGPGAMIGPTRIVAPMPGRIVKVLVQVGQAVAARQPLIVVEAMKMENELRAPVAGIVSNVRITEGAAVEANSVLIEFE